VIVTFIGGPSARSEIRPFPWSALQDRQTAEKRLDSGDSTV